MMIQDCTLAERERLVGPGYRWCESGWSSDRYLWAPSSFGWDLKARSFAVPRIGEHLGTVVPGSMVTGKHRRESTMAASLEKPSEMGR